MKAYFVNSIERFLEKFKEIHGREFLGSTDDSYYLNNLRLNGFLIILLQPGTKSTHCSGHPENCSGGCGEIGQCIKDYINYKRLRKDKLKRILNVERKSI